MPDEQKQSQQSTLPSDGLPPQGQTSPNGNGHVKAAVAPAQEGGKYAPVKPEEGENKEPEKAPASPIRKLLLPAAVIIILLVGIFWGIPYYHYSQTHVGTDDAYITGNLVNVSPIISGTLDKLTIEEGDTVKQGQLIAHLEASSQLAALRQAQAAYNAALSQLPQARTSLTYQQQATQAAIQHAEAALAAQTAKTQGAQQQVALSAATVQNQVRSAQAQIAQAEAQAAQADANVKTAQAGVASYQRAVRTAQANAAAVASNISGAQANYDKARNDAARYASLYGPNGTVGAVTAQQNDAAQATFRSAESQLSATQNQVAQAQSQVDVARANVTQAQAQLEASRKQADATRQQVAIAHVAYQLVLANLTQVPIQRTNVANNLGQGGQAAADLATAQAGQQQIALKRQQITTYQAQADQSKEALANAKVTFNETSIYAPTNGTVVKKAVNVGAALSAGQTIVTITQGNSVWVEANFKETQLHNVRAGQPAEVEVDAFTKMIFKGRVQSINEATGASTALLPPDNATGNFTKVVQRIPVKILLVSASNNDDKKYARQGDINNLRQGMSVTATIDTSNAH